MLCFPVFGILQEAQGIFYFRFSKIGCASCQENLLCTSNEEI